jgi:hypothetical protein
VRKTPGRRTRGLTRWCETGVAAAAGRVTASGTVTTNRWRSTPRTAPTPLQPLEFVGSESRVASPRHSHVFCLTEEDAASTSEPTRAPRVASSATEIRTAGPAASLQVFADRTRLQADGEDVAFLTVQIKDKGRTLCPLSDHLVAFHIEGDGRLAGVANGKPGDGGAIPGGPPARFRRPLPSHRSREPRRIRPDSRAFDVRWTGAGRGSFAGR